MFSTPLSTTISGVTWAIFGALTAAILGLAGYSWYLHFENAHLSSLVRSVQADRDEYKKSSDTCDAATKQFKVDADKAQSELNARMDKANLTAAALEKRAAQYAQLVRLSPTPAVPKSEVPALPAAAANGQACSQAESLLDTYITELRP